MTEETFQHKNDILSEVSHKATWLNVLSRDSSLQFDLSDVLQLCRTLLFVQTNKLWMNFFSKAILFKSRRQSHDIQTHPSQAFFVSLYRNCHKHSNGSFVFLCIFFSAFFSRRRNAEQPKSKLVKSHLFNTKREQGCIKDSRPPEKRWKMYNFNTSLSTPPLMGVGVDFGSNTPRTPEILNSLIAMTNPFEYSYTSVASSQAPTIPSAIDASPVIDCKTENFLQQFDNSQFDNNSQSNCSSSSLESPSTTPLHLAATISSTPSLQQVRDE